MLIASPIEGVTDATLRWSVALIRRVAEKEANIQIDQKTYKISWPGMISRPDLTGIAMLEFAEEQYGKIGFTLGDLKAFWNADRNGGLMHVFGAYQRACMIDEADRELSDA